LSVDGFFAIRIREFDLFYPNMVDDLLKFANLVLRAKYTAVGYIYIA
jgi:hypothetical protein